MSSERKAFGKFFTYWVCAQNSLTCLGHSRLHENWLTFVVQVEVSPKATDFDGTDFSSMTALIQKSSIWKSDAHSRYNNANSGLNIQTGTEEI